MKESLDCFAINWRSATFDSDLIRVKQRYASNSKPEGFLKALFGWTEGKRGPFGVRFRELYEADLELYGDWRFARPLGKGSFGVAALFNKYLLDEIVDEVVIKDVQMGGSDEVNPNRPALSREAVIMSQINDLEPDSLLRLRNYKCFHQDKQYRYFFENCGHGDLELLRLKYKAWQIQPPEAFLWHLFSWLTEAHVKMTEGPFRSLRQHDFGNWMTGSYLIHGDIKTENVLLQPKDSSDPSGQAYPNIKVADFGLSRTTSQRDHYNNQARDMQRGTEVWYAPEIRIDENKCKGLFAEHQSKNVDPAGHIITTQANLWPMAAIVWTFITGREIEDLDDILLNLLKNKQSPRTEFVDPMELDRRNGQPTTNEYSQELQHLVRDCLKLLPKNRPTFRELQARVTEGSQDYFARAKKKIQRNPQRATSLLKLYCHANEINDVQAGTANYRLDSEFWRRFVAATLFISEDWGSLLPPTAPEDLRPSPKWSSELQKRWLENMKRARGEKRPLKGQEEMPESAKKRVKVWEVFRDIKNAVPFLRRRFSRQKVYKKKPPPEKTPTPTIVELAETPKASESSSGDGKEYRPVMGGLVEPSKAPLRTANYGNTSHKTSEASTFTTCLTDPPTAPGTIPVFSYGNLDVVGGGVLEQTGFAQEIVYPSPYVDDSFGSLMSSDAWRKMYMTPEPSQEAQNPPHTYVHDVLRPGLRRSSRIRQQGR